jgi:predicted Zn-dependent peptidase
VTAARMMSAIFGGSMSSRLFISVRERQGLCYSVSSSLDLASDIGTMVIYTGTDPAKASTAVASIVAEMEKIVADGVTAEEVEKGKAMLKGRYVLDREDSMAQGYLAAAELLYRGKVSDQKEQFDLIDGVTAADIQAAAARYLRPDEIRGALVGPPGLDVDGVIPIAARAA